VNSELLRNSELKNYYIWHHKPRLRIQEAQRIPGTQRTLRSEVVDIKKELQRGIIVECG
jgi:hypothetical protein